MHQSFATTSPLGRGNSRDIDFSICKAQVKSLHCRDFVLVKSRLSCTDRIKTKKSRNLVTFFCSTRIFSIRSVATDKLNMTAIYSKWTFILLNRKRLFVILNQYTARIKHFFNLLSICFLSAILKSRTPLTVDLYQS